LSRGFFWCFNRRAIKKGRREEKEKEEKKKEKEGGERRRKEGKEMIKYSFHYS
jgi:hypothetical protein